MGYTPIFLEIGGQPCLVVGGGVLGERRTASLLEAGADVTVISPELTPTLEALAASSKIRHLARRYRRGDMRGFTLVYAATDDPTLHRELFAEAKAKGILINVVDQPELCSFIVPAVVRRGDLQVAISTSGASPALARRLREEIASMLGPEYATLLEVLRAARARLQAGERDPRERARRLSALAASELGECLLRKDLEGADRLLDEHLGRGMNLSALGFPAAPPQRAARAGGSR